ncbi:MAG TPA: branched-chain amino acid ABC transporter permease [Acetobacteraceae bacterium]|nr:branched-chain amino acid ABC transporter permease [Acetobacteraceae bacterium]
MLLLQILVNGVLVGGLYVLIAQSLNLIFGVMGVVNLAHGSFIVLAGLFTYWFTSATGLNPLLVLPLAFVVLGLIGAGLQPLLVEPLMKFGRKAELLSLMVTFGLSYVLLELALQLWGSDFVSVPYLQSSWSLGGLEFSKAFAVSGAFAAAVSAALYFWLNYTDSGKCLLAASQSSTGAICCGIDVRRVRLIAFGLGVGLAAAAGVLVIIVMPLAPQTSDDLTLLAFVIIALGGLGNYGGVAIAAILLGIAQSLSAFFLGGNAEYVLPYVLLILVMVARPERFRPA